jgi:cytochrome P450
VTRLVNARLSSNETDSSDGESLTDPELLEMLQTLLSAAGHTTTRAMTEMFHQLAKHPYWWDQASNNPESRPAIIEESVRFAAPAVGLWRKVTRDTQLGGVDIPARGKLLVSFASATRDEDVVCDPQVFDPDREELRSHLAWGRGIHACLGQSLARAELRAILDVLTSRLARVAVPEGESAQYERNYITRGIAALPLEITYR